MSSSYGYGWRPSVADWGDGQLLAAPWVQLSVSTGNGWPHNELRHHWLMPIRCHFRDCKLLLVPRLTHVIGAIASVQTFTHRRDFICTVNLNRTCFKLCDSLQWRSPRATLSLEPKCLWPWSYGLGLKVQALRVQERIQKYGLAIFAACVIKRSVQYKPKL